MRAWTVWAAAIAIVGAFPEADAGAVGTLLAEEGGTAGTVERVRVTTLWQGEFVTQIYEIEARGGSGSQAWLVPVPNEPELLDTAVGDATTVLEAATRPVVELVGPGDDGCGGGGGSVEAIVGDLAFASDEGATFAAELLSSTSGSGVANKLEAAGWTVPEGLADALGPYAARSMGFALGAVDGSAGSWRAGPLVVHARKPPDGRLLLPTGLQDALLGEAASGTVDTLVLVSADKRYRIENQGSVELPVLAAQLASLRADDPQATYSDALDAATASSAGRLAVTELALPRVQMDLAGSAASLVDDAEGSWVTRLRARTQAGQSGDTIVVFAKDGPVVEPVAAVPAAPLGALGLVLGLCVLASASRRRQCEEDGGQQR